MCMSKVALWDASCCFQVETEKVASAKKRTTTTSCFDWDKKTSNSFVGTNYLLLNPLDLTNAQDAHHMKCKNLTGFFLLSSRLSESHVWQAGSSSNSETQPCATQETKTEFFWLEWGFNKHKWYLFHGTFVLKMSSILVLRVEQCEIVHLSGMSLFKRRRINGKYCLSRWYLLVSGSSPLQLLWPSWKWRYKIHKSLLDWHSAKAHLSVSRSVSEKWPELEQEHFPCMLGKIFNTNGFSNFSFCIHFSFPWKKFPILYFSRMKDTVQPGKAYRFLLYRPGAGIPQPCLSQNFSNTSTTMQTNSLRQSVRTNSAPNFINNSNIDRFLPAKMLSEERH